MAPGSPRKKVIQFYAQSCEHAINEVTNKLTESNCLPASTKAQHRMLVSFGVPWGGAFKPLKVRDSARIVTDGTGDNVTIQ